MWRPWSHDVVLKTIITMCVRCISGLSELCRKLQAKYTSYWLDAATQNGEAVQDWSHDVIGHKPNTGSGSFLKKRKETKRTNVLD